ncbi:hypothetical protein A2U01_0051729, partial [Trifolium medium]|nr:hypothetical protein [Trifolium medium]
EWSIEAADKETESADEETEATNVAETGNSFYHDRCFYPFCSLVELRVQISEKAQIICGGNRSEKKIETDVVQTESRSKKVQRRSMNSGRKR